MGNDLALDEACAIIGAALSPHEKVDVDAVLHRLDELSEEINHRSLEALITSLFTGPRAFRGNLAEYYSPQNSFLHRVLETRSGIPITLSIVLIEVGRRLGLNLSGVGMPAHFIVGMTPKSGLVPDVFIDPFHSGQLMDLEQCRALFHRIVGQHHVFDPLFVAVTPSLGILERVLNNLKTIYSANGDQGSLRTVMMFRSRLPGIGTVEVDEFRRLMAPYN